ncbi:MAG: chloride channel protein [Tepidisphaeraceae bacterium]
MTALENSLPVPRRLSNPRLLMFAVLIGIVGGIVATLYYLLLQGVMHGVWLKVAKLSPLSLPIEPMWRPSVIVISTVGGLIVGLLTRWLGSAGEIASVVDNIHLRHGRIDVRQTPAMTLTSLASISAGGSAGPEAPLVQIIGSCASWLGDRMKLEGSIVRTFTFCGMGAALGAFFGAPLGGALFALEIPHRRGMEYYEAMIPGVVAAMAAFLVFRSIVGYEHIVFHLHAGSELTLADVWWGIGFGVVGAAVAMLFAWIFAGIGRLTHPWEHRRPVLLATLGGLAIGLLAQASPKSLFWGEYQIDAIINSPAKLLAAHTAVQAAGLLALLAIVKMIAVGATLHTGFRGGFIFPLMFVGACVGTAIGIAFPQVPMAVAIVGMMAAVNVAVTKTPISTSVILVTLTGTSMMPVVIAASLVSLLLTTRLNLIQTQRERGEREAPAPTDESSSIDLHRVATA